jgi:hypothetical protein
MKTISEIKAYVKPMMEDIALKNHTIKQKQDVKVFDDRISIACVCCGDSDKVFSKKRGNLYLKSLRYKCFNCGVSYTLFEFLKMFNQDIDLETKRDLADYVEETISRTKWHEEEFVANNMDKLIPIEKLTAFFNSDEERNRMSDFRPVTKGSKVYQYLIERKIANHDDIYEATYWHNNNWNEPVLVNMNQAKGKVIGIQTRNLKGRDKRFYKIFSFSELYKLVNDTELDEIEKIGYDKLSYLYNILKVNWGGTITIFEGFLDTKFFPNAIGCVGTNTDINFIVNQGVDIRFFYDYDAAGIRKSKEYIKKGKPVFLWERLFEAWSAKTKNPYSAYQKLTNNVVDLNDVAKISTNPYSKLELEKYFSKDQLDIMWIKDIKSTYNK